MDEYIKRDAVKQCRFTIIGQDEWICAADILKIPAADVVEVVRCRDCIHRRRSDGWCGAIVNTVTDEAAEAFFCADGERRTDG